MSYTNNVPQGNQTIAATQPLIQANFGFIQSDLQIDHVFNGNNSPQPEGTHIQAQMKNRADPVGLSANINGIYYVSSGLPKFYNSSGVKVLTQSITATGVTIGNSPTFAIVATLPLNASGSFYIWRYDTSVSHAISYYLSADFVSDNNEAIIMSGSTVSSGNIVAQVTASVSLQARTTGGSSLGAVTIIYTSVA